VNLILLPILTLLVLAFGYRFLGRLVASMEEDDKYYNTDATIGAASAIGARLHDFGILGTPILLAGAAFGLRYGWAPAFLWILLAGTTLGAASALVRSRLITPPALRTANTLARLALSALLALLWAGLAANATHALLAFFVLYLSADRLIPFLMGRRADWIGGLFIIAAVGVLFAALGMGIPLALTGPTHILIGPYERSTAVGPLFFYALLFVMLIQKKRADRLVNRPAYGAIGALLLGTGLLVAVMAALIGHPVMSAPRLRSGGLWMALPMLASALPFGAALAPFGNNPLRSVSLRTLYSITLIEAGCAIAFLMGVIAAFPTQASFAHFFAGDPRIVSLLLAGISGNARLTGLIGLGPWLSQVLLAGLLLLIAASLESQQERLAREPFFPGPIAPLMATALIGALLWVAHGLHATDEILIGALLGIGASGALIFNYRAFPGFVVSLGLILLTLTDAALIVIGWADPSHHPLRAGLSVAVMMTEAVAAVRFWGTTRS